MKRNNKLHRITALTLTALTLAACTQADVPVSSMPTPTTTAAVTIAETAVTTTEVSGSGEVTSETSETDYESQNNDYGDKEIVLLDELKQIESPINLSQEDIEDLKRYKTLSVRLTEVTDLSFLEELVQLERLYISNGKPGVSRRSLETEFIESYEFIDRLVNLKFLSFSGDFINGKLINFDIKYLNCLDKLEELFFYNYCIINTSDVVLNNMINFGMTDTDLNIEDVSTVFPNLKNIQISINIFGIMSFLNCKNIEYCYLQLNDPSQIEYLSGLSSFPNVKKLEIVATDPFVYAITDISFLLDVSGLRELTIRNDMLNQQQIDRIKLKNIDCEINIVYSNGYNWP